MAQPYMDFDYETIASKASEQSIVMEISEADCKMLANKIFTDKPSFFP